MHTVDRRSRRAAPVVAWTIAVGAVAVLVASRVGVLWGIVRVERVEALWMMAWPGLPVVGATIQPARLSVWMGGHTPDGRISPAATAARP